jgi:hypothetical protein
MNDITKADWIILRLLRMTIGVQRTSAQRYTAVRSVMYLVDKYGIKTLNQAITALEDEDE